VRFYSGSLPSQTPKGDLHRAARLVGASNRIAEETEQTRDVYETQLYEETLTAVQATLGNQATTRLLAEGAQLQREEAIAAALDDPN
jgi:hypothetical protein